MKRRLIALGASVAFLGSTPQAQGHFVNGCRKPVCKRHVIKPYKRAFLGPVGACESGTTRWLRHGLRALSPGGQYRGRYQFDWGSWAGAGGRGDPSAAGWLEQAYRAVVWLHLAGRQAWPNC